MGSGPFVLADRRRPAYGEVPRIRCLSDFRTHCAAARSPTWNRALAGCGPFVLARRPTIVVALRRVSGWRRCPRSSASAPRTSLTEQLRSCRPALEPRATSSRPPESLPHPKRKYRDSGSSIAPPGGSRRGRPSSATHSAHRLLDSSSAPTKNPALLVSLACLGSPLRSSSLSLDCSMTLVPVFTRLRSRSCRPPSSSASRTPPRCRRRA